MRFKICFLLFAIVSIAAMGQSAGKEEFERLAKTLASLTSLKYDSYREINNFKDNYFHKNTGTSYFEFDNTREGGLYRFQLKTDKTLQVYNGSEYFCFYEDDKTYEKERKKLSSLSNLSLLFNSILTIRLAMPEILKNDSIEKSAKDTLIDQKKYRLLKFAINKKALNFPYGFEPLSAEVIKYYDLIVDPKTTLPYMIIDRNSIMGDQYYTKTVFSNLQPGPVGPASESWFFSSYTGFKPKEKIERRAMIANAERLPDLPLAYYKEAAVDSLKLSSLKGKKVVLEFWIKNCAYCMAAFPGMKSLHQQFGKSTEFVSVNAYEERNDIEFFFKREKPQYKMLYGGEKLANQIGIYAYPSVVIIDESGKVIYSKEGFDEKEIAAVLDK